MNNEDKERLFWEFGCIINDLQKGKCLKKAIKYVTMENDEFKEIMNNGVRIKVDRIKKSIRV